MGEANKTHAVWSDTQIFSMDFEGVGVTQTPFPPTSHPPPFYWVGGGGRGSAAPLPTLELYKEDLGIRPKRRGFVGLTHSTQEHPGLMDPGTPLSARNRIPLFFCFGPPNFASPLPDAKEH